MLSLLPAFLSPLNRIFNYKIARTHTIPATIHEPRHTSLRKRGDLPLQGVKTERGPPLSVKLPT